MSDDNVDDPLCRWCGRPYVEHQRELAPGAPIPRTPCQGLRSGFLPADGADVQQGGEIGSDWSPTR